jgi:hypothetical protein
MNAWSIYKGSDGDATRAFYAELERRGPIGVVALNLFRAQKSSTRAKAYRRRYKGKAYDKKSWSLEQLIEVLKNHGPELQIAFGWGRDESQSYNQWVLYVDLPQGQVSFHSPTRGEGPDYPGVWDGKRVSEERIITFAQKVFDEAPIPESSKHNSTNLALSA